MGRAWSIMWQLGESRRSGGGSRNQIAGGVIVGQEPAGMINGQEEL